MKRWLAQKVGGLLDRSFERFAKKLVREYFFTELHPATLLFREAQAEAAAYVKERMPQALYFLDRLDLLRFAMDRISIPGMVLEFGVFKGKSISLIGGATDGKVHGFDTFEGLPEDWAGNRGPRGEFSTRGVLPPVPANVVLHKGLFEETLPPFMDQNREDVAFAHVDCDLYGSTKTVFENVGGRLRRGSVLVFDDYFNFPGWRNHEFKAFQELVEARGLEYRYIGYARHQAAVVIDAMGKE